MNLPRKCGQLYIKFDESNQPEYGFDVVGNQIKKFISLTDNVVKSIILPKLVDDCTFDISSIDEKSSYKLLLYNQKIKMQNYVLGRVKICDGCFKGLKEAKIIVPFENSVMLDWGAFEENAKIELVIHKNLTLKQVYRRFDTGFDYEHENWTLIGDKKVSGQFGWDGFMGEGFSIMDYNEKDLDYTLADFTLTPLNLNEGCAIIQPEEEKVK